MSVSYQIILYLSIFFCIFIFYFLYMIYYILFSRNNIYFLYFSDISFKNTLKPLSCFSLKKYKNVSNIYVIIFIFS